METERSSSVRDQRIREQELSGEVRLFVLQQFRERLDPADTAKVVAKRFPLDQRMAYRWTAIIYDELERSRRWIARICVAVMWLGAFLVAISVIGAITGRVTDTSAIIPIAIGGVPLVGGIVFGLNARRLIPSR